MNTSTTILAVIVQLLVVILPMFGITVGSEELTATAQTIIVITTGLWIWWQRLQRGDVKLFGGYKPKYNN